MSLAVAAPPQDRQQLWGAYSGLAFLVLLMIGLGAIAQLLPPPQASDTARDVVGLYTDDPTRRIGLLVCFAAGMLYAPLVAVLGVQMLRLRAPVLATLQCISGGVAILFLLLPFLLMLVAAFRPGRDPQTTQALHDTAWIMLVIPFPPFAMQLGAFAIAVLGSDGEVFPRWLGYLTLWAAILAVPAGLLVFFKTGPFAWHGLISFWLVLAAFGTWLLFIVAALRRAILEAP